MPDRIESYKVICRGGLNSNENHLDLAENSPGAATRLVNYEPSLYGGYRRIDGYLPYDEFNVEVTDGNQEGPVLGLALFRNEGIGNPYVIACRKEIGEDNYYFFQHQFGVGWTKLTDAPTRLYVDGTHTVKRVRHVQFDFGTGGAIAFADGVNPLVVFDGTTWTEVDPAGGADQALYRPAVVEVFENHLFTSGDPTYSSVVAHSAPNNATDWTAASGGGQLALGFPVVQIKPYRDNLFTFGSNSIKKITVSSTNDFVSEQVTANVGCIARDSVQEIGGDLVFLAPDGIRPVASTSRIGDVELETISRDIRGRIRNAIEEHDMDTLTGVVVRSKSQVRYFFGDDADYPGSASAPGLLGGLTTFDSEVAWEFADLVGFRMSCATSEYIGREEYILHGDYDGTVYRQEQGETLDGDPIISIYSTPYLDMGDTEVRKVLHRVNTFIRAEGPFTLNLSVDYDWGDQYSRKPAGYEQTAYGAPTNYDTSGTEYGGDNVLYGGNNKPVIISDIQGSGFSARLTFTSASVSPSFSIQGVVVEFAPSGRR